MGGFLSPSSRNRSAIFPERGMFLNHRACPFLVRFRRFDPSTHLRGPPPPCLGGRGRWGPPILSVPLFLPISTGNIPVRNPVVDPDRRDPEGEGRTGRDHQGVSRGDPFRPGKGERDRPGQPSISKAIPVGGTSPPPPHPSDSGSLFPRTTDRMVRAFGPPFWLPGGLREDEREKRSDVLGHDRRTRRTSEPSTWAHVRRIRRRSGANEGLGTECKGRERPRGKKRDRNGPRADETPKRKRDTQGPTVPLEGRRRTRSGSKRATGWHIRRRDTGEHGKKERTRGPKRTHVTWPRA